MLLSLRNDAQRNEQALTLVPRAPPRPEPSRFRFRPGCEVSAA
jgi:hypothetical protein